MTVNADGTDGASYAEIVAEHYRDEWDRQIKDFTDWFVVEYRLLIISRCKRAASLLRLKGDAWEDLVSECIISSYAIAKRFDPSKGDIVKYMISSLWRHAFASKYISRYSSTAKFSLNDAAYIDGPGVDSRPNMTIHNKLKENAECENNFFANSHDMSLDWITKNLDWHERMLLNCKLVLKMNNCQIASCIGVVEATVRYRLNSILNKLKIKGDGSDLR